MRQLYTHMELGESKLDAASSRKLDVSVAVASEPAHVWRSCCLDMDSRALLFFTQLLISVVVLAFNIQQIATASDCHTVSANSMSITFILGVWLPAPRASK